MRPANGFQFSKWLLQMCFLRITKMLKLIPSTLKWMLADREPLETWVHKEGKVALLGDACHPMLVSKLARHMKLLLKQYSRTGHKELQWL